jgi:glycosyltransferase involved in cell wall biosynthesis
MARARTAITKIGVEARVLGPSDRRGVAQYLYRLIAELLDISDTEEYHIIVDQDINPINVIDNPRFIVRTVPACRGYRFNTWLQFRLPAHILRARYDLVFYSYNVLPLLHPTKSIVTIHDVKIQKSRGSFLGRQYSDGGKYLPGALRTAERLILVSEFTRREAEKDIGPLANAVVIHEGIAEIYDRVEFTQSDVLSLKKKYGIRDRFVMAFGASTKHKNIAFLVRSFLRVRRQLPGDFQLLLVGCQEMDSSDYFRTLTDKHSENDVVCVGFVSDTDVVALYNCTDCFVYPSLYEGFGFPPLEAMACGAPVLASNVSAIPEIVGDAAETFDPTDSASFDLSFIAFLSRLQNVGYRQALVAKAYEHAKGYSWRKTAEKTLRVFHEVIGTSRT